MITRYIIVKNKIKLNYNPLKKNNSVVYDKSVGTYKHLKPSTEVNINYQNFFNTLFFNLRLTCKKKILINN